MVRYLWRPQDTARRYDSIRSRRAALGLCKTSEKGDEMRKPCPPMEVCDCLNQCGDDPRVALGTVFPCQRYLDRPAREKAARYSLFLSLKAEFEPETRSKRKHSGA